MKQTIRYVALLAIFAALIDTASSQPLNAGQSAPSSLAPVPYSGDQLEELVAPIALYPDPLIAAILPAAAHQADIASAARFVAMYNNLADLEKQPWDVNVKAVARFPSVIQKMNDERDWTAALGQAFTEQPLELMDAIQALREQAYSAGALQTTPQQVVTVNEAVVERFQETQIVYVTNTVIQITPANPQVVYVPVYDPAVIFVSSPTYVYSAGPPLIVFGPGIGAGVFLSQSHCDWYYGGVYYGHRRVPQWWHFGHGRHYYPPPPNHRPPPFRPRPPPWTPGKPHQPPGGPSRPPGKPSPSPGNPPPKPGRPEKPGPPQKPGAPEKPGQPQKPGSPQKPGPSQQPGNPAKPPGNQPRPPGSPPPTSGNPPATPGNSQPPGQPQQPPGNSPQKPGPPGKPGSTQPPGKQPRAPGNSPRQPGNSPKTPGKQPQSQPRSNPPPTSGNPGQN